MDEQEITGSTGDAEGWIGESALPEADKQALLSFVRRFPTLSFYRTISPSGPGWLRELRAALDGPAPDGLCWFRLRRFEHPIPHAGERRSAWYHRLGFSADLTSEYDQIAVEGEPLLFVAGLIESLDSVLAVKAGPDSADQGVYEFDYADVAPGGGRRGQLQAEDLRLAFDSVPAMFKQIGAIKLQGDTIVEGTARTSAP